MIKEDFDKMLSAKERVLHLEAQSTARLYKRSEIALIEVLEKVDASKLFYKLGYNSLFTYTTQSLGLSNEVAYTYIRVARKSQEIPQLKSEIKKGSISVSKAKKICSVITKENQNSWLSLAKTETSVKIEKSVALASPKLAIRERIEYVHPSLEVRESIKVKNIESVDVATRVQLTVGVSEKLMLKIRRAQEVLSQRMRRSVSLEETLSAMTESYLHKFDPLEKAKRYKIKTSSKVANAKVNTTGSSNISTKKARIEEREQAGVENQAAAETPMFSHSNLAQVTTEKSFFAKGERETSNNQLFLGTVRKPIPQSLKHQLYSKSNGTCSYVGPNGHRCRERRFLEIHHRLPVSEGGANILENLVLVCSGHHKSLHK